MFKNNNSLTLVSHPLIFLVLFLWMHWFLFHNEISAINIIHLFIILNVNLQLFLSKMKIMMSLEN